MKLSPIFLFLIFAACTTEVEYRILDLQSWWENIHQPRQIEIILQDSDRLMMMDIQERDIEYYREDIDPLIIYLDTNEIGEFNSAPSFDPEAL